MRRPVWNPMKWGALALAATLPLSAVADEKNPQAIYDELSVFAEVLAIVQDQYVEEVDTASLMEQIFAENLWMKPLAVCAA